MTLFGTLRTRVVVLSLSSLSLALLVFAVLLGRFFRHHLLLEEEVRLQTSARMVLGQMEIGPNKEIEISLERLSQSVLQDTLSEVLILDENMKILWASSETLRASPLASLESHQPKHLIYHEGTPWPFRFLLPVTWEQDGQETFDFSVLMLRSDTDFRQKLRNFRRLYWAAVVVALMGVFFLQSLITRRLLKPLAYVVENVDEIRRGKTTQVHSRNLEELDILASAINELIQHQDRMRQRYAQGIDNLAHSLKTPLASLLHHAHDPNARELIHRMTSQIDYHLKRASVEGIALAGDRLDLLDMTRSICGSIAKAYSHKSLTFDVKGNTLLTSLFAKPDMYELLGNLIDNAAKWAKSIVRIRLEHSASGLEMVITDDGPGFSEAFLSGSKQRGVRYDELSDHGIGLSVVGEIVDAYHGQITYKNHVDGGACVTLTFPPKRA